jgi:hypothetical protein
MENHVLAFKEKLFKHVKSFTDLEEYPNYVNLYQDLTDNTTLSIEQRLKGVTKHKLQMEISNLIIAKYKSNKSQVFTPKPTKNSFIGTYIALAVGTVIGILWN